MNKVEDYPPPRPRPLVLLILLNTNGFAFCHLVAECFMFLLEAKGNSNRVLLKVDTDHHVT